MSEETARLERLVEKLLASNTRLEQRLARIESEVIGLRTLFQFHGRVARGSVDDQLQMAEEHCERGLAGARSEIPARQKQAGEESQDHPYEWERK